eukprot:g8773.t1
MTEINEAIDLLDSLQVVLASGNQTLGGHAHYHIDGSNLAEVQIILQELSGKADDVEVINDVVSSRLYEIKERGAKSGFKEDVEALLFCANSAINDIRLSALTIIKKLFGLEIGWDASEPDEQRYHALCTAFVKKGPRIIADLLVQNYTNEIDTLLEIVAFSSSHILLRRQYIEIIIQPLMLYVLPNNIEKHRILALTALKHNSVAILIAVCDLIAALAKESFTDVSGIGVTNFDEHGMEVPRTPLSMVANRRDLIIKHIIQLHYPFALQPHFLVHKTNILQILFWLTRLPIDMHTVAPWTAKIEKEKLPFPWHLHQIALDNNDIQLSAMKALWTLALTHSARSQFYFAVRHQHSLSETVEKTGISHEKTADVHVKVRATNSQNASGDKNSDVSSEDNFDEIYSSVDTLTSDKTEKYDSPAGGKKESIGVDKHTLDQTDEPVPPFIYMKTIKKRDKRTGTLGNALAVYLNTADNRYIKHAVGHFSDCVGLFYTTDGSEPLWEFQAATNGNQPGRQDTQKNEIPCLTTRLYKGKPIQIRKYGLVTIKAVTATVPSHWGGLEDELERVHYGRMFCRLGKPSKVALKIKYLKASVEQNKRRFQNAVRRLNTVKHFKLLAQTSSLHTAVQPDMPNNTEEHDSDDPDEYHDLANAEMHRRLKLVASHQNNNQGYNEKNEASVKRADVTISHGLLHNISSNIESESSLYAVMTIVELALASASDLRCLRRLQMLTSGNLAYSVVSNVIAHVRHGSPIPSAKTLVMEDGIECTVEKATRGLSREFGAGTTTPMLHDEGRMSQRDVSQMFLRTSGKVLQRSHQVLYMYVKIMIPPILEIIKQTPINIVRKDIIAAIGYLGLCPYDDIVEFIVSKGCLRYILIEARGLYFENHTRSPRKRADGDLLLLCVRTLTIYACHDCLKNELRKSGGLLDKEASTSIAWEIEHNNPDFGYYLTRFYRQILRRRQNILIDDLEYLATLGTASLLSPESRLVNEFVKSEIDKKQRSPGTVLTLVGSSQNSVTSKKQAPLYEVSSDNDYAVDLDSIVLIAEKILKSNDNILKWIAFGAISSVCRFNQIRNRIVNTKLIMDATKTFLSDAVIYAVGNVLVRVVCMINACSIIYHLVHSPHDMMLWLKFESQIKLSFDSSGNYFPAIKEGSRPLHLQYGDNLAKDSKHNGGINDDNKSTNERYDWGVKFHHGDCVILSKGGIKLPAEFTISVWFRGGSWLQRGKIYTLLQSTNGDKIVCLDEKGRIGCLRAGTVDGEDLFAKWYCTGVSFIKEVQATPDKVSREVRSSNFVQENIKEEEWHHLCIMGHSKVASDKGEEEQTCDFFLNGRKLGHSLDYKPSSRLLCVGNTYDGGEAWGPICDFRLYPHAFGDSIIRWPEHLRLMPPLCPMPKRDNYIHWESDLIYHERKLNDVRAAVVTSNCIPYILPLLAHPSTKARILACSTIANLALYTFAKVILISQWVCQSSTLQDTAAYATEYENIQESIVTCNDLILATQLKLSSKSGDKGQAAHDAEMLQDYRAKLSGLEKRARKLKNKHDFDNIMSRKRLIESLLRLATSDKSKVVRQYARAAILNMH